MAAKGLFKWLLDVAGQVIVAAILGSAAVTSLISWLIKRHHELSWDAAWALWTTTAFVSFLLFVAVGNRIYRSRPANPTELGELNESIPPASGLAELLKALAQVRVITHSAAAAINSTIPNQVLALFRGAGWKTNVGTTSLPEDAIGITVYGPNASSKTVLKWAMRSLGYAPRVGARDDKEWQVVVGVDAARTDAGSLADQKEELGVLAVQKQTLTNQVRMLEEALAEEKRDHAYLKLKECAERVATEALAGGGTQPVVTVRFIVYQDREVAAHIHRLFDAFAKGWRVAELEQGNGANLPDLYGRRFVFECGVPEVAEKCGKVFTDGNLLLEPVKWADLTGRGDYHLFITVFPRRTG